MHAHPYFDHDATTAVLAAITLAVWIGVELRQSTRHRPDAHLADRGSHSVLRVTVAVGAVGAALSTARVPGAGIGGQPAAFIIGLVLMWSGIALRLWSFHALGQYFTFKVQTSPDQQVIDTGPYRLLRHPSYSAIALIFIGVGLLYGNWIAVAALAVLPLLGLIVRIHVEEHALIAELGPLYKTFAATRKRLVPFIW